LYRHQRFTIAASAALILCCTACTQAPPPPDPKALEAKAAEAAAKDVADIKALEDKFIKAFNAKDVNAIMSLYVPDSSLLVFDVAPPRQYVGAVAYKKDWEEMLGLFPGAVTATLSDGDVTATGGDVAWGHSIQSVSGKMKDGKKLEFTVRVTDGYKRVNGQWLIAHEHVSVPVDVMTGKADLTSKP